MATRKATKMIYRDTSNKREPTQRVPEYALRTRPVLTEVERRIRSQRQKREYRERLLAKRGRCACCHSRARAIDGVFCGVCKRFLEVS